MGHLKIIKKSTQQENITIMDVYVPHNITSKYNEVNTNGNEGEMDNHIITRKFNNSLAFNERLLPHSGKPQRKEANHAGHISVRLR